MCNSQLNRADIFNPSLAEADVSMSWLSRSVCECVCARARARAHIFEANSSQWQINQLSAEHKVHH